MRVDRDDIIKFLRSHTCYDFIPESGKVVVLDVRISVKLAFFALVEHELTYAPLWSESHFNHVGMLSSTDLIDILEHGYRKNRVSQMFAMSVGDWLDLNARLHKQRLLQRAAGGGGAGSGGGRSREGSAGLVAVGGSGAPANAVVGQQGGGGSGGGGGIAAAAASTPPPLKGDLSGRPHAGSDPHSLPPGAAVAGGGGGGGGGGPANSGATAAAVAVAAAAAAFGGSGDGSGGRGTAPATTTTRGSRVVTPHECIKVHAECSLFDAVETLDAYRKQRISIIDEQDSSTLLHVLTNHRLLLHIVRHFTRHVR